MRGEIYKAMSADEKTYIEAKLELLEEIRSDVKTINAKVDAINVAQIAAAGRIALVEEEARKNHCPRAGLCVELEKEINTLKQRQEVHDADRRSAFVVWKVLMWVFGALSSVAGFIWLCVELYKSFKGIK